jgi:hypothetical protein
MLPPSVGDREARLRARRRLAALEERLGVCAELHQVANLAVFYGPRPLRDVPLGRLLVEGWWAA